MYILLVHTHRKSLEKVDNKFHDLTTCLEILFPPQKYLLHEYHCLDNKWCLLVLGKKGIVHKKGWQKETMKPVVFHAYSFWVSPWIDTVSSCPLFQ